VIILEICSIAQWHDKPLLPVQHETVPADPAFSAAVLPFPSELLHVTASHGATALSPSTTYIHHTITLHLEGLATQR